MSPCELYDRPARRRGHAPDPTPRVRVTPGGNLLLNAAAATLMKADHVQLLIDAAEGLLALRPAANAGASTYRVQRPASQARLHAGAALRHMGRLPAEPISVVLEQHDYEGGPVWVLNLADVG